MPGHPPEEFALGPMTHGDLRQVLALERRCFGDPWSRASFEAEIGDEEGIHWARIARRGTRLAGFVIAWYILDEAHIANLAVTPMFRFMGLGRQMVQATIAEARRRRARWVGLEVRVSNHAALELYKGMGFRPTSRRRGYYREGPQPEDALVMTLDLTCRPADGDPLE